MKKTPRENTAENRYQRSVAPSKPDFLLNRASGKILPRTKLRKQQWLM